MHTFHYIFWDYNVYKKVIVSNALKHIDITIIKFKNC